MAKRCKHDGEIELREVGVTDDIYKFKPGAALLEMHSDMSEDQSEKRVKCLQCERVYRTKGWNWEDDPRVPAWARKVLEMQDAGEYEGGSGY